MSLLDGPSLTFGLFLPFIHIGLRIKENLNLVGLTVPEVSVP